MTERYDLYCELNHEYHGYHQALLRYSKNPTGIRKGERITVGDKVGRRAQATVVDVWTNQIVFLDVDITTFHWVE